MAILPSISLNYTIFFKDTALLNKDLLEVLPGVEEANAISEELDKKVKFEIMLLSPQWLGKMSGRTEVRNKMFCLKSCNYMAFCNPTNFT